MLFKHEHMHIVALLCGIAQLYQLAQLVNEALQRTSSSGCIEQQSSLPYASAAVSASQACTKYRACIGLHRSGSRTLH
jgi:hypothetical protein